MFIGQEDVSAGGFTQQADNATITNVTQYGLATTAGNFSVAGITAYAAFANSCPPVP